MNSCEEYLEKIERSLPELCSVEDLIDVGIYNNPAIAFADRKKGEAPDYFQIGFHKRVIYPRGGVIAWLRDKIHIQNRSLNGGQGNGQICQS